MKCEVKTLAELSIDGKGHYGIAAPAVAYSDKLPTYLRITDIKDDGTIDTKGLMSVNDDKAKNYFLKPNDIVFARTGASTGRNYFYDGKIGKFVYAGFLIKFSIDEKKVNPKYIKYYCSSKNYKSWVSSFLTGSTRGNINAQTYANMPIILPDRKHQDLLVEILSSLDDKIELNNAINHNLQQQAQAIFKSWFIDFEPFGGKMPDDWKVVTLEQITTLISRGISPKYIDDSDQMVLNQKCIRNHMIDLSLARNHIPKVVNEKWIRFGDLLINSTGDGTLGRVAQVWFKPKNLTVDSHITVVRPANRNLNFYVGFWAMAHEKEIEALHTGSTGQTELPRGRIKEMKLFLPDNFTLSNYNVLISPITANIISNLEENNNLKLIRDTLLPKLMSGQLDISEIEI